MSKQKKIKIIEHSNLMRLDLSHNFASNTLTEIFVEDFLSKCDFPSLRTLMLDYNNLKSAELSLIMSMKGLRNLKILSLRGNNINRIEDPVHLKEASLYDCFNIHWS